jgi:hypothetical protein
MFRLTKEQFSVFENAALGSFILQSARHFRRVLPERVAQLDDDALVTSLRKRLTQALAYGITDRLDVLRYLECSYLLGWTDDGPDADACALLARTDLQAEEKVDIIERRTESI